jgi:predicted glycosyltransferase
MAESHPASASGDGPGESAPETPVRVLFDVGHPAQVHLFRNAIAALESGGHEAFVTARQKEDTVALLEAYGIPHVSLSRRGESVPGLALELLTREVRLFMVAREFKPDVVVSRLAPAPAHVSRLLGCRNVAICDTYVDKGLIRRLYHGITLPFVDTICVPASFDLSIPDAKRRAVDFQELAYLHPDYFEPDPSVLTAHGIDPESFFTVIRVAGWDAYHDVGDSGLSLEGVRRLVDRCEARGSVFISAEHDLPEDLTPYELPTDPEDVHHVLYYADCYVGDSGTMSTEAAMLATPAIRTNSMVGSGDENVFHALENRYGLLRSFAEEADAIRAVEGLFAQGVDQIDWTKRRERLLEEQPNVTEQILETVLEDEPATTTKTPMVQQ